MLLRKRTRDHVEKQTRRALRGMAFWRVVVIILNLPCYLMSGIIQLCTVIKTWLADLSDAAMYFELDAARRYKALTGLDLGFAVGSPTRYAGLVVGRADRAQSEMFDGGDEA